MKSLLHLSLFAVILLVFACNKSETTTPTPPSDTMQYTVNGLTNLTLRKKDSLMIAVSILHTGGKQEKLDLSVSNLPSNVTATFQTKSGIPTYATLLTLKSEQATPGVYPIKVVATPATGTPKEFQIDLNISNEENNNCVASKEGFYAFSFCQGVSSATIDYVAPNKLTITSFVWFGDTEFIVDCDNNMIICPEKTDGNGLTTSGSGIIINDKEFNITMKKTGWDDCSFHFTKK